MKQLFSEMAEQAILGLILTDNSKYGLVEGRLTDKDFYFPYHSQIFSSIEKQIKGGLEAWPASIQHALIDEQHSEAYARQYLTDIFNSAMVGGNILTATHIVLDFSFKRKMVALSKSLAESSEKGDEEVMGHLQKQIADMSVGYSNVLPDDPQQQLESAFELASNPEPMIPTGIQCWDETFGGIAKGVRYIIAGRAGSGKTALALNIAWNAAKSGRKVRYIFFEGKVEEIWHRILAREMQVPITSFRKGLTDYQKRIVISKQELVQGSDFAVVRNPRDVGEMLARCGQCDIIVLDGISSAPAPKSDTLIERVTEVTAYCKTLADKTGAAVIMLAHLNSDGIKQAGTGTGIFGGQAATFDPESILELRADEETNGQSKRKIDGIITKNRYGELKTIHFGFTGEYMTYGDW